MSWLSSKRASGMGSVRGRLPVQAVRRLCACTQGRLQVRRTHPGHRYFHGCSPHSSHGDPLLPPPPPPPEVELALAAALPAGGGSSRSSSIPVGWWLDPPGGRRVPAGAVCGDAGRC